MLSILCFAWWWCIAKYPSPLCPLRLSALGDRPTHAALAGPVWGPYYTGDKNAAAGTPVSAWSLPPRVVCCTVNTFSSLHGTTRELLNQFSWNLMFTNWQKVVRRFSFYWCIDTHAQVIYYNSTKQGCTNPGCLLFFSVVFVAVLSLHFICTERKASHIIDVHRSLHSCGFLIC